jgi:hypothetical protein
LRDYVKLRAKLRKAKDASQVAAVRERIKALNFPSAQALRMCVPHSVPSRYLF